MTLKGQLQNLAPDQGRVMIQVDPNRSYCTSAMRLGVANTMSLILIYRALLGLWIFHRLLGGGGAFKRPPPMISAPGRCREKRKAAFDSSRKNYFEIISVIFWLRSKLRSTGVKIPKFSKTVFRQ